MKCHHQKTEQEWCVECERETEHKHVPAMEAEYERAIFQRLYHGRQATLYLRQQLDLAREINRAKESNAPAHLPGETTKED